MATKKPKVFKSFDELDPDRVIITGNVNIVNDDPIIDTTKKGASDMASKKKKEDAPAADVNPTNEAQEPQETKQPAEAPKAEAKETKSEETKTNKGEEIMSNENKETKIAAAKPETTATPAAPAAPSFANDPELKKLLENLKDGKVKVEVEHKQPSAGEEFLRGLAWGGGIAIGVTVVTLAANALFGGGESSAE